jgi:hypothetical protein
MEKHSSFLRSSISDEEKQFDDINTSWSVSGFGDDNLDRSVSDVIKLFAL